MSMVKWSQLTAAVLASIALSLTGCDSENSDTTPPDHIINLEKSQGKYRFGVTDTISITFSEKIDTSALALDFTPAEGIGHLFVGGSKLLIFGKNVTYGTGHFNINSPFFASLTGLQDTHGNGQTRIEASFLPYPWADRDFIDSNFRGYDSLFATDSTWLDGSPITDSLIVEGALDFKKLSGNPDYSDIKVVSIGGGDTLLTTLDTRKNLDLNLKVAGPYTQQGLDSVIASDNLDSALVSLQTGSKGSASARILADLAEYKRKFKDTDARGLYLIYIGIPQKYEGFYRLEARVHAFK